MRNLQREYQPAGRARLPESTLQECLNLDNRQGHGSRIGLGAPKAQYFGRNKVQYTKFHFQVLKTPHFDIYFYPEEADAAQEAGRLAERWNTRLSQLLQHELRGRQPIILYASHADFAQTNVVEGELGEGTGGVTESARRRVTLPLAASIADTDHVLGHELVHAFQYDILGPNAEGLPLWFIEGMAEYLSLGARDVQTAMWLRDAMIQEKLPTVDKLDDPRYFPYRFGHAFWAYIGGRWGDAMIGQILHRVGPIQGEMNPTGRDAVAAIERATGRDRKTLSAEWHAAIADLYGADTAAAPGGTLIGEAAKDGSLSVGPALSPDGSRVAFLSSRSRLSIDLYLADAVTGKVTKKLISTASDPHFDSLQFLASAGAWDPAGERLALGTLRGARPVLAIVDAARGRIAREITIEGVSEIFQPSWSPDGQSIVFSAQVQGHTDLFVHDLASGATRRLTNDVFADLQPAWSPDGRQIAFVTDRFGAQPESLSFTGYRLAVMAADGARITPIETGLPGNAINPQWADNGRVLCFVSDSGGRQNAYRLDLGSGRAVPITNAATGVAGITPASPALSVAAGTGKAAITVFHDSGYEIRVVDAKPVTVPPAAEGRTRDLAMLPPGGRTPGDVTQLLQKPAEGLPPARPFEADKYKSRFSLIDVGQTVGVTSMSEFGTYASGGISLLFSDVLGNHLLGTGIAINGGVKDVAAEATYINRTSRWNWGFFGQRVPLLSGDVRTGLSTVNGQTVFVQQTELFRQTYNEAGAFVAYPFSRASRLELSASTRRIGFDRELRTQTADPVTGVLLSDDKVDLPSEPALNLRDVGAALVRDTSAFGATSPILGQRARLEVTPTFGDLQMVNVTADYRQYFMPVRPITLAGRILHVGRYGGRAEDDRLIPLFLGYSTLVRGYDVNSFDATDCTPNATSTCPEFDRLIGSRILVLNGELRAPLAGLFTGNLDYGPVPVELLLFADSGVAWTRAERPSFAGGTRDWVTSVGAGARVNVFGFAIAEFNLARPLNRGQRGWRFVFNLRPGF